MEIYDREFFERLREDSLKSADEIVPDVADLINPKSVVDVGCGVGRFLLVFLKNGAKDVLGIDGNWINPSDLEIPSKFFLAHDLNCPLFLGKKFDLVVSLEVAEHLFENSAETFIDTLTSLGDIILFSAAIPGQRGTNHLNEQWPEYWVSRFSKRGYTAFDFLRKKMWKNKNIAAWYRQNLLLFFKNDFLNDNAGLKNKLTELEGAHSGIISMVLPEFYNNVCSENIGYKKANEELEDWKAHLQSDNKFFEESNSKLQELVLKIEEHSNNLHKDNENLKESNFRLQEAVSKLEERNISLQNKNNIFTEKNVTLQALISGLERNNDDFREKNTNLQEIILSLTRHNNNLQKDNSNLLNDNIKLGEQRDNLNHELNKNRLRLDSILNSKSYRFALYVSSKVEKIFSINSKNNSSNKKMNKEKKYLFIISAGLIIYGAGCFLAAMFLSASYLVASVLIFIMLSLFFAVLLYLKIQHNIDKKNAEIFEELNLMKNKIEEGLENQRRFSERIAEFFEMLLENMEKN